MITRVKMIKFSRSIFVRMFVSKLLLIMIPLVLIGFLSFQASERIISQQLVRINYSVLIQTCDNINNLVGRVHQLINLYMLDNDIQKALKATYSTDLGRVFEERDIESKISTYSLSFNQLRTHTLLLGTNGSRFTAAHDSSSVTYQDIMKQDWFAAVQSSKTACSG